MSDLDASLDDLVIANHILSHEGVLDAFGHVSIRHPDDPGRYFLSCSRAPELVVRADIMEFDLDNSPVDQQGREMYGERVIHGGLFEVRADVNAVVHHHSPELIPFSVTDTPLKPMTHMGATMGPEVPVWDIHDEFGDTDLLLRTREHVQSLARALGNLTSVLVRGHGCVVVGGSVQEVVMTSIYMQMNGRLQAEALRLGSPKYLWPGEAAKANKFLFTPLPLDRAWEYWCRRSRIADAAMHG